MAYTIEQVSSLYGQQERIVIDLRDLLVEYVRSAETIQNERVEEHLRHGVARRINVLAQCLVNIYRVFPPTLERPLEREALSNVQINLHA